MKRKGIRGAMIALTALAVSVLPPQDSLALARCRLLRVQAFTDSRSPWHAATWR